MATIEETNKAREVLVSILNQLAAIKPDNLVREDVLGKELSFRSGLLDFQRILGLFNELTTFNLDLLPYIIINKLQRRAEGALNIFSRIKSFSPGQATNPANERNQLLLQIREEYDSSFAELAPWVSYLLQKETDLATSKNRARQLVGELENLTMEQRTKLSRELGEIEAVLATARSAAAEVGVTKHANEFVEEARLHRRATRIWLCAAIAFGIAAVVYAWWSFGHTPEPPTGDSVIGYYIHFAVPRIIILSVISYGLIWSSKNFLANRHNEIVNRHRQNALRTFETFVKAAGNDLQTKNAVLLQATQAIFTPQATGYLSQEPEVRTPNTIIEILRDLTGRKQDQ